MNHLETFESDKQFCDLSDAQTTSSTHTFNINQVNKVIFQQEYNEANLDAIFDEHVSACIGDLDNGEALIEVW